MHLSNSRWKALETCTPEPKKHADAKGRPWVPNRPVLEGILWVLKSGARWKDLPKSDYPPYQTCHRRFQQWSEAGIFFKLIQYLHYT